VSDRCVPTRQPSAPLLGCRARTGGRFRVRRGLNLRWRRLPGLRPDRKVLGGLASHPRVRLAVAIPLLTEGELARSRMVVGSLPDQGGRICPCDRTKTTRVELHIARDDSLAIDVLDCT